MVQRNLVQAVPVILFFILIAGMFSVVLLPVNIEIYGTVTDNEGNPLNHVYMYAYTSDGLGAADGGVDSQGHFSLLLHEYGEYEVWAVMPGLNYWQQVQMVEFESQHKSIRLRMDFQLIRNIPCNVTLIASFWSVNSTHTSISFGYNQEGKIATLVGTLGSDDDSSGIHVEYENHTSVTLYGSDVGEYGGYIIAKQNWITGYYSNEPGEVQSCSVINDQTLGTLGTPATDYLSPENASEGWIEEVQPQNYRGVEVNVVGNLTLPDALSVPVDVDILGKRYQTILPCIMLGPDPGILSIWVTLTNLDSVPHSYKFFVEGGHIIHIWEIS